MTKSSIADTFDYYLVNSGIIDPSSGITFSNIVNWTEEGEIFAKICTTIGKFEQNINEIDINELHNNLKDIGLEITNHFKTKLDQAYIDVESTLANVFKKED